MMLEPVVVHSSFVISLNQVVEESILKKLKHRELLITPETKTYIQKNEGSELNRFVNDAIRSGYIQEVAVLYEVERQSEYKEIKRRCGASLASGIVAAKQVAGVWGCTDNRVLRFKKKQFSEPPISISLETILSEGLDKKHLTNQEYQKCIALL